MFNGLEGIMGSGKSYEATVFHVLAALKSGRKVITNLPLNIPAFAAIDPAYAELIELRFRPKPPLGTWDATRVDEHGNGNAFQLGPLASSDPEIFAGSSSYSAYVRPGPGKVDCAFGGVWCFYDTWRHEDGRGPLFVIDECHNSFPKTRTDPQVIEYIKLHRHFNADILAMTQNFRSINVDIADVIAMLVKVRKADILGHKDSYIRKVHAGYRGAVISVDERKYQPHFFPLYKSHTQGRSVAESDAQDVAPLSVKLRRITRGFWVFTLLVALAFAYWYATKKPPGPKVTTTKVVTSGAPPGYVPPPARAASAPVAVAQAEKPRAEPEPPDMEPLKDKLIHITGWLKTSKGIVHTFAVSAGGMRQFNVVSADLVASGYRWQPLADCIGYLTFEGKTRAVTCDSPRMAAGSDNAPVVMDFNSGKRSDAKSTPL